mmetsp:Transcript_13054/g.15320  ORF Transcript_13054/g.15320 Transcript_13054/m.15320 type:complete len:311 (+) Transcript_13054:92-1024(+)|eukprot:CAMPEP_0198266396 /NCGR_PEP_ID=MMETSP1447-20131203/27967_1 /TAXON_ID=420782 /ORGANISM="Chaetoceros dichaeta, Strain CCMP1751" /LENGTH=310 /DNA_ID=CAMNT_0043956413 /DNA_START=91 /DNA_END=1023 /DNA_ORIENTATION=-
MKLSAASIIGLATSSSAFIATSNRLNQPYDTKLFGRKPFITGNWKLNPKTKDEAIELATEIASTITPESPDVALFVPFPFIECVQKAVGDKLEVGAEMCTPETNGAFTGGIAPAMLASIGCKWALAGHSERRTINGETDEYINAQCVKLLEQGMSVILCVGETLSEFELDLAGAVCLLQLKKGLAGISAEDMSRVSIAYEPVWAIGTGKVATPEIAQDVHGECRKIIRDIYGKKVAEETRILYGGSVSPELVDGLLDKPDIDGALVGGASLTPGFGRVINFQPIETKPKLVRAALKIKSVVTGSSTSSTS